MTKADLVEQVADAIGPGITKKDCALVVDGFLNAVKRAMANGENIEIRGFGTFKVRKRKSRMARNPRTGEAVEVPSRSVPVFKPSKHLRTRVSQLDGGGGDSGPMEEPVAPTEIQTRLGGGFDF
jgi:integration host factor beta subunit